MLYEVAIVLNPSTKEAKKGEQGKLLLPPTAVLADSRDAAIVAATQQLSTRPTAAESSRLEVLVRPFAE